MTGLTMTKNPKLLLFLLSAFLFMGCEDARIVDVHKDMINNNWTYIDKVQAVVTLPDSTMRYNTYFRLRLTAAYKYTDIYVLFKITGNSGRTITRRYGYKVARKDGQWLGRGSGDLYTYKFPLLTNRTLGDGEKYTMTIEQNMRDNPLRGVSDAGILVEPVINTN